MSEFTIAVREADSPVQRRGHYGLRACVAAAAAVAVTTAALAWRFLPPTEQVSTAVIPWPSNSLDRGLPKPRRAALSGLDMIVAEGLDGERAAGPRPPVSNRALALRFGLLAERLARLQRRPSNATAPR